MLAILTDALPAVRYGDADVGVLSAVRHQIICLLVATRSSCLFARARPTDKQGNYFNRLEMHHVVFKAVPFVRCCLCFWLLRVSCFYIFITSFVWSCAAGTYLLTLCRGFRVFLVIAVLQVLVFYFVRCVLAFSCCVCELYFYKWVLKTATLWLTGSRPPAPIKLTGWFVCLTQGSV